MTQRRADERLLTRGCRGGDRPGDLPVGACTFPTCKAATSQWEHRKSHWEIPLGAFGRRLGLSNRGSKSEWAHGGSASWWGGGGSRGEAALAFSHSAARVGGSPLPCARHFLWGTFLPDSLLQPRCQRLKRRTSGLYVVGFTLASRSYYYLRKALDEVPAPRSRPASTVKGRGTGGAITTLYC